jgi:outer membrane protein TolC
MKAAASIAALPSRGIQGGRRLAPLGWRLYRLAAIGAAAGALLGAAMPAQAVGTDLLSLTRDALLNDPTYASARFGQSALVEVEPEARANLLPNLSASLGESATRVDFRMAFAWKAASTAPLIRPCKKPSTPGARP